MSSFEGQPGAAAPGTGSILPSSASKALEKVREKLGGSLVPPGPPRSGGGGDGGGDEEDGMLRMSFMEHLEELRSRILKMIAGIIVAAVASLAFCQQLWNFVRQPAAEALTTLGYKPDLVAITPMEQFNVIWFKMPFICAIFISSPWILYQIWAFISPGLYRRERRWAAPFILCSAGLFILGGVFAYFVIFRYGLTFLLSIGQGNGVVPMVTITEYFDLFVNVMLGVGLVFEMPVIIFFLTLLRIVSPMFLLRHSRYAILAIFIIAAIVTPTPDVFNLMLFATPMCLLFYVGIFAGYLVVLHRENRRFPWRTTILIGLGVLMLLAGALYLAITKYGFHLVPKWPFLMR
jgi:sec-independent protein translocase protein TatC